MNLGLPNWNPADLTFDAGPHTYRYRGQVVPSVTQILDRLHYLGRVPWEVLETARTRGSNVHLATELFDQGCLDENTVDPSEVGYLDGWRKFVQEHKPTWFAIERRFYHPTFRYAGTPDRFCELDYNGTRLFAQLDVKTSASPSKVWGLQTAAYNAAAGVTCPRLTCQLRPNGTYKLIEWKDPRDWPWFLSLINIDALLKEIL